MYFHLPHFLFFFSFNCIVTIAKPPGPLLVFLAMPDWSSVWWSLTGLVRLLSTDLTDDRAFSWALGPVSALVPLILTLTAAFAGSFHYIVAVPNCGTAFPSSVRLFGPSWHLLRLRSFC